MSPDTLITALSALTPYGGRVSVASNLPAAIEAFKPWGTAPVAILYGMDEAASPNELATGGPRHRVAVTIKLMTAARDVSDPHGKAAYAQADTARASLLPGLLGIVPDTDYDPIEYKGGQLVYAEAGTLLWLDQFITSYYLTPA